MVIIWTSKVINQYMVIQLPKKCRIWAPLCCSALFLLLQLSTIGKHSQCLPLSMFEPANGDSWDGEWFAPKNHWCCNYSLLTPINHRWPLMVGQNGDSWPTEFPFWTATSLSGPSTLHVIWVTSNGKDFSRSLRTFPAGKPGAGSWGLQELKTAMKMGTASKCIMSSCKLSVISHHSSPTASSSSGWY